MVFLKTSVRLYTGFTFMELIVALCVLGILTAIALPGYQAIILKTRRTEGQAALLNSALAMESYYAQYHTYEGANDAILSSGSKSWYLVKITEQSKTSFALQAVPLHAQAQDTQCQTLTLNSLNIKGIAPGPKGSPTGIPLNCWQN